MKRRVRIYRPENSMNMMQMGGVQAVQQAGTQDQAATEDQLVSAAMTMIGQGASPDDVVNEFVKNNIPAEMANAVVSNVIEYINQQQELGNAALTNADNQQNLAEEEQYNQAQSDQAEAQRKQRLQEMMMDDTSQDYSDDEQIASDIIMKFGGNLPKKNTFINNVMKLVKKQTGGDNSDSMPHDDRSYGIEKSGLSKFVGNLQNNANNALMKEDAEAMYNMLNPYFQENANLDLEQAQYGGLRPGQVRRMNRRINRMIGQVPAAMYNANQTAFPAGINIMTLPMMGPQQFMMPGYGSYVGGPRLANIDVRRVGLFGKPKEYSITFAQDAYFNPNLRQDVVDQEEYNLVEEMKDVTTDEKAKETNTATTENAEVQKEVEKTEGAVDGTGGRTGKDGTKKKNVEKKKPDTGDDVNQEVSMNSKLFEGPDLSKFYEATANDYSMQYFGKTVKIDGKEVFKKWAYNPRTKEWFREGSKTPLKDPEAVKRLNTWLSGYSQNVKLNAKAASSKWTPDQYINTKNSFDAKLPSFSADIMYAPKKVATGLDPGNPNDYGAKAFTLFSNPKVPAPFTFKPMPKGYLPGQRTLPNPQGGFSSPGNWTGGPKGLPYSGSDVRYVPPGGFQEGGFTDYDSGLYRFVYGGNDSMYADGDFMYDSVNIDDPYFQSGGLTRYQDTGEVTPGGRTITEEEYKFLQDQIAAKKAKEEKDAANRKVYDELKSKGINVGEYRGGIDYSKINTNQTQTTNTTTNTNVQQYPQSYYNPMVGAMYPPIFGARQFGVPGRTIEYAGTWAKQKGLPFDPRTGQVYGQVPTDLPLTKLDVTKTSLFGKRPKEYTMYFGNYGQLDAQGKPTTGSGTTSETAGATPEEESAVDRKGRLGFRQPMFGGDELTKGQARRLARKEERAKQMRIEGDQAYANMFGHKPSSSGTPLSYDYTPVKLMDVKRKSMMPFVETTPKKSQEELNKEWEAKHDYKLDGKHYIYKDDSGQVMQGYLPEIYEGSGSANYHPSVGFYQPGGQYNAGVYTTNPGLVGMSDIDLINSQTAPQVEGIQSDLWQPMPGSDMPVRPGQENDPTQYEVDPEMQRQNIEKEYDPRGFAVKYKNKDMYNVDFERGVNQFNTYMGMGLAALGERGDRKRLADFYNNLTADNLYGSTGMLDRGTYETNSGLFRPDEMGFKGVVKYGGMYQEGGTTWMSEEQIRQFLADGGELEFI